MDAIEQAKAALERIIERTVQSEIVGTANEALSALSALPVASESDRKDAERWKTAKSLCGVYAGWWQVQIRANDMPAEKSQLEAAFERDIDAALAAQRREGE